MRAHVDIIIVGAGIHGAGCAQAAAAAGYSVLLLEQTAIAAGSSSRSSKLIHGGLRYLESGQLRLVRESLRERTHLLRLAPELVRLRRFFIPVYGRTRRRPWQLRTGLSLYALLAGFAPGAGFGTVPRSEWAALDGLETEGLQAVFWYHDGQTDDRLLTRAVVHSALALGAELLEPARFIAATRTPAGVQVQYQHAERHFECSAGALINAAGPWADAVAGAIRPALAIPALERVRGTHIVLAGTLHQGIYYVESPRDGRAVFAMPWHGETLVGTTEAPHHGTPDRVEPSPSEIHYLLGIAKHYFPRLRHCTARDLRASFAGLRVLPAGQGHAFHRSRETLLVTDTPRQARILSIYGGKLTTWRAVAERALQRLAPALPVRIARAHTTQIVLGPPPPGLR